MTPNTKAVSPISLEDLLMILKLRHFLSSPSFGFLSSLFHFSFDFLLNHTVRKFSSSHTVLSSSFPFGTEGLFSSSFPQWHWRSLFSFFFKFQTPTAANLSGDDFKKSYSIIYFSWKQTDSQNNFSYNIPKKLACYPKEIHRTFPEFQCSLGSSSVPSFF